MCAAPHSIIQLQSAENHRTFLLNAKVMTVSVQFQITNSNLIESDI